MSVSLQATLRPLTWAAPCERRTQYKYQSVVQATRYTASDWVLVTDYN